MGKLIVYYFYKMLFLISQQAKSNYTVVTVPFAFKTCGCFTAFRELYGEYTHIYITIHVVTSSISEMDFKIDILLTKVGEGLVCFKCLKSIGMKKEVKQY